MHGASLINLSCPNVKLKINALMEWRIKRRASERVSERKGKMEWIVVYFHWCENLEISCCFGSFSVGGREMKCSLILYAFRSHRMCSSASGLNKIIDSEQWKEQTRGETLKGQRKVRRILRKAQLFISSSPRILSNLNALSRPRLPKQVQPRDKIMNTEALNSRKLSNIN